MTNRFKGKNIEKTVKFMGEDVQIAKLSVMQVMEIQEDAKGIKEGDEKANLSLLTKVIAFSVKEFKDVDQEEIFELPMDELSKLSSEIMKYSGLAK